MPKGDEDRPDFSLPVAALFDKVDRDSLLELVEKFPEIKFLIYAPDSGQVRVKIKYADCFLGFIYTKVFVDFRLVVYCKMCLVTVCYLSQFETSNAMSHLNYRIVK